MSAGISCLPNVCCSRERTGAADPMQPVEEADVQIGADPMHID